MNVRKNLIDIGREIGSSFKESDKIDTMLITGSLAEGFPDKHSDVDIICYCNQELTLQEFRKLFRESNYKIESVYKGDDKGYMHFDIIYKGCEIDLILSDTTLLKECLKNLEEVGPSNFYKQRFYFEFIVETIIVFDKLDIVKENKERVKEVILEKFKDYTLRSLPYKLDYNLFREGGAINTERDRNNFLHVSHIFSESLRQIYRILYALNDKFFTSEKWMHKYLKNFELKPNDCAKRLKKMAMMKSNEEMLDKKIELFREFIRDLKQIMENENIEDLPDYKIQG